MTPSLVKGIVLAFIHSLPDPINTAPYSVPHGFPSAQSQDNLGWCLSNLAWKMIGLGEVVRFERIIHGQRFS